MIHNICSVADIKFISNILALNNSIKRYNINYKFHILCIDDQIFYLLKNKEHIYPYRLKDILELDPILSQAQNNRPSREAIVNSKGDHKRSQEIQFIWSLSAYFTNFCLKNTHDIKSILYIDSDIYFFDDWSKIFDIADQNLINIGLVEHRIPYEHNNGKYNVGIVYFRNNEEGNACSSLWKDCVLDTSNRFYNEYGDCGDQKYLELFPKFYKKVESFDKYFGHIAPWNFNFHSFIDNNNIIWMGQTQNLMYCHFSNFKPDFINNTYIPAQRHGINNINNIFLQKIYNEYFLELKKNYENYIRNDSI